MTKAEEQHVEMKMHLVGLWPKTQTHQVMYGQSTHEQHRWAGRQRRKWHHWQ